MKEVEEATIKVVVGTEKKSHVMTDKEKKLTAYHEGGSRHCNLLLPSCRIRCIRFPLCPRGMSRRLHHADSERGPFLQVPQRNVGRHLVVLLGGRVAEALVLHDISTGASNDIERATATARAMVTKYGMSENLGPIKYGTDNSEPFLGRDMGHVRDYSEETASEIDAELRRMIHEAYEKTENILNEHMDKLHEVAKFLFEHEKDERRRVRRVLWSGKPLWVETTAEEVVPPTAQPEA